ncbi:2OG-Fe(II) oxygenase family protein [Ilumatobacter sp.]|uniref:2OG-Fe(II) oxygenase family protein n=1 Tax=Ilumatobacter sp. TaxID=1967498 RepID=UPI003AF4A909
MDVAVVDFTAPDAPERFTDSLRDTGFAVLVNHPVPWSLVEQIYREWSALFDSPAIDAYDLDRNDQAGWFPADRSETAKGNSVRDLKEFFHVFDWSIYPTEVTDAALQYRRIALDLALTLLDWVEANTPADIAARLSMPLSKMIEGSTQSLLRVLRYPPLPDHIPDGAVRAAVHEDINLLTVLPASDQPGLELLGADGTWFPVPCDPGSLAINGGEMLDLATDGHYPATTHRVVNPTGDEGRVPRTSLPLFLAPADDVVLARGRTASSFLQERLVELRGGG